MSSPSTWIKSILFGYRTIKTNGVPAIERPTINIRGATVTDDPVKKETNIILASALPSSANPTANTIAARNGSGGSAFTTLSIYDTVPPTGVQTAYINGATGIVYADNGFQYQSGSIDRVQPYAPIYNPTEYSPDTYGRLVTSVNTAVKATFDLDIPHNATLTAVSVHVQPALLHAGLPASMPAVLLVEVSATRTITTLLAGQTDQSADVTAFELAHAITIDNASFAPLAPTVVDRSANHYKLFVTSEAGANAVLGLTILGVVATYSTNTYRK